MPVEPRVASEVIPPGSRRAALFFVVRSLLVGSLVVVGYFVLPLDSPLAADTFVELAAGIGLVVALLALQVRAILRSPYPGAKAVGALMVSVPLFLVLFAATYYLLSRQDPKVFSEPLTRLDALYFTVTVFTTVGFGDITATAAVTRAVTTVQMAGDLVLIGLFARVVVGAVKWGRAHRSAGP